MANQIAKSMSDEEQGSLDNMDMNEMISHVTKNVLGMMNNPNSPLASMVNGENMPQFNPSMFSFPVPSGPFGPSGPSGPSGPQPVQTVEVLDNSESESESSDCIYAKTRDICFELNVDLKDFYTGKKKKLNVKRKKMVEIDGKQTVIEEKKKLIIPIEKGMKDEQQIRFEGEADQIPGYKPGDIIITLIENEHPEFQRDGDNLIMIKNINLYQSYDYTFDLNHLDDLVYRISSSPNEALHVNDCIRKISGLGMPSYKSIGNFGDLFIRFNLVLPKSLLPDQLILLKDVFKDDSLFLENKLGETFHKTVLLENVSDADLEELENLYTDSESETESETESESESETESEGSDASSESSDDSEISLEIKKKSLKKK